MSPPDSIDHTRGAVLVAKPKADVYTVMLAIALAAILIACIVLGLELRQYNFDIQAAEAQRTVSSLDMPRPAGTPTLAQFDAGSPRDEALTTT